MFVILVVFLKEFFRKKNDFEKYQQKTKNIKKSQRAKSKTLSNMGGIFRGISHKNTWVIKI